MYDAFISYSHSSDALLASNLRRSLQRLGKRWYQVRASRVFRDEASLPATAEIWPTLVSYLESSRYLIVVASREAGASYWVNREIEWWLQNRNPSDLLLALADGSLIWDNKASRFSAADGSAAPPALTSMPIDEPFWIDLSPWRRVARSSSDVEFQGRVAALASAIRSVPKEDILSEELRAQRQAVRTAWAGGTGLALLGIAVVGLGFLLNESNLTRATERAVAEEQRLSGLRELSIREAVRIGTAGQQGDGRLATELTLDVLPRSLTDQTLYADEALVGLVAAPVTMRLATINGVQQSLLGAIAVSEHEGWYAIGDENGISLYDARTHLEIDRLSLGAQNSLIIDWSDTEDRFFARFEVDDEPHFGLIDREGDVICRIPVSGFATMARFSPDGRMILVGERDGTLRSYETETCGRRSFTREFEWEIRDIAFSSNAAGGFQSFVASLNGQAVVLDESLNVLDRFNVEDRILGIAISRDGDWLARPAGQRGVDVFSSAQLERRLDAGANQVFSMALSTSGRYLAVAAGESGTISIWQTSDWALLAQSEVGSNTGISRMRFISDDRLLAFEGFEGAVFDLRLPRLSEDIEFGGPIDHDYQLTGLETDAEESVSIWRIPPGSAHELFSGEFERDPVLGPAEESEFALGGIRISDALGQTSLIAVRADGEQEVLTFDGEITRLEASPSGDYLLVSFGEDSEAKIVAIALAEGTLRVLWERPLSMGEGRGELEMHTDRDVVALRYESVSIEVVDIASNETISILDGAIGHIMDMAFLSDGRRIAAASRDGRARIWDLESGDLLVVTETTGTQLFAIAGSPDSLILAAAGDSGSVELFTVETGASLDAIGNVGLGPATAVAFSPSGEWLFVAFGGDTIRRFPIGDISQEALDWLRVSFPRQTSSNPTPELAAFGTDPVAQCLSLSDALGETNPIPGGPILASPNFVGVERVCAEAVALEPEQACLRHTYARVLQENDDRLGSQREMTRAAADGCAASRIALANAARLAATGPSAELEAAAGLEDIGDEGEIIRLFSEFNSVTDTFRRVRFADLAASLQPGSSTAARIAQATMIEQARPQSEEDLRIALRLYHEAIQAHETGALGFDDSSIPIARAYERRAALAWALGREEALAVLADTSAD